MMSLAERLATRIFVIHQGREVAHDTTDNLLKRFHVGTTVEIKAEGKIPADLQHRIGDCFPSVLPKLENGHTLLIWREPEQHQVVQLFDLMDQERQTVLSIKRREASLEEVFLSLTKETV
jgi:ABC-type multidrug transport system ATPase subunit